jgi:peptidoglycan/xylan/chitin deacetylase (PgdA/CDA1 family)
VTLVAWNVMALDGLRYAEAAKVTRRVLRGLRDGAIVILHDAAEGDGYEPASVAALPAILDAAAERGLRPVSVQDFLAEADR